MWGKDKRQMNEERNEMHAKWLSVSPRNICDPSNVTDPLFSSEVHYGPQGDWSENIFLLCFSQTVSSPGAAQVWLRMDFVVWHNVVLKSAL